jgi:hypothetical protein
LYIEITLKRTIRKPVLLNIGQFKSLSNNSLQKKSHITGHPSKAAIFFCPSAGQFREVSLYMHCAGQIVFLLSPDRPYYFTPTLKLFIGKLKLSWKDCLALEPNSTFLSFNPPTKEVYGIISLIVVERVFKTVNKYKSITNSNT